MQNSPSIAASEGPPANEDLTILEHLGAMRSDGEHRPGEQCFLSPEDGHQWVEDGFLKQFLAEYGSVHPSDFLSSHANDWQSVLFENS